MKQDVLAYYQTLSNGYDEKIRQLVPKYDEMTALVVDRVAGRLPRAVLDIGCGTGSLTERILDRLPEATATALDASPAMARQARERLARFGQRARVVEGDVTACALEPGFDVLVSSLVLHNLDPTSKARVLQSVVQWLEPQGAFVWADLIRQPDPASEANAVAYRRRFALEAGCDPDLVTTNFHKEATLDCPVTVEGMIRVAAEIGLPSARLLWTHDAFAVLEFERGSA